MYKRQAKVLLKILQKINYYMRTFKYLACAYESFELLIRVHNDIHLVSTSDYTFKGLPTFFLAQNQFPISLHFIYAPILIIQLSSFSSLVHTYSWHNLNKEPLRMLSLTHV